jgi:hypothetical protein
MKTRLKLFPVLLLMVILLTGCGVNASQTTNPGISTQSTNSSTSIQPSNNEPTEPISIEVAFPNSAPSLNQEAEINCIIKAPAISLENVKIEIRLPEALKLVSGSLMWSGNISEGDEFKAIDATVQSIKTGNWSIELRKSMNPQKQNAFSFYTGWQTAIYISISENSAEWNSRFPPWKTSTPTVDTSDRPPPPATSTEIATDDIKSPSASSIEVNLSTSSLPLLNTPFDLTCTMLSKSKTKLDNCSLRINLPEGAKLIHGDLEWQGNLESGELITFTNQVIFTEIGKWTIKAIGTNYINTKNSIC